MDKYGYSGNGSPVQCGDYYNNEKQKGNRLADL